MLEYEIENRSNIQNLRKKLYNFKSKKEFEEEFDFKNG